jgi:hypothetical protein
MVALRIRKILEEHFQELQMILFQEKVHNPALAA